MVPIYYLTDFPSSSPHGGGCLLEGAVFLSITLKGSTFPHTWGVFKVCREPYIFWK